jgi:hypothetical protein
MNTILKCTITFALSSAAAGVVTYEGFDPNADPTLPTLTPPRLARALAAVA